MERFRRRLAMSILCLLAPLSIGNVAFGQPQNQQPEPPPAPLRKPDIPAAIEALKNGDFSSGNIVTAAKAGPALAIPILEQSFDKVKYADTQESFDPKEQIANALVSLGDKRNVYWDYLLEQATLAVDGDVPFPFALGGDPNAPTAPKQLQPTPPKRPELTPEFLAWAKAHNLSPESAEEDAMYWLPGKVLFLAETGDPRGVPLLQRALWSKNFLIQSSAAQGLAQAQDKDSIPLLIAACERSPAAAGAIALFALVYFDDPEAQAAAAKYLQLPKDQAAAILAEAKARKKPFDDLYSPR